MSAHSQTGQTYKTLSVIFNKKTCPHSQEYKKSSTADQWAALMLRSAAVIPFCWFVWLLWKTSPCVRFKSRRAVRHAPNETRSHLTEVRLTSGVMALWSSLPTVVVCHRWAVHSWSEGHVHAHAAFSLRCCLHCQWFCLTAKQPRQLYRLLRQDSSCTRVLLLLCVLNPVWCHFCSS